MMKKNIRNIFVVLTLMAFLLPSVIKLNHHHENHACHAKSEKHLHQAHENCAICEFEFSIFTSDIDSEVFQKNQPVDNYTDFYRSADFSSHSAYSFLLRAPPIKQI